MKHIKTFEDNIKHTFNVGDIVKCASKEVYMTGLSIDSVYKIEGFKTMSDFVYAIIHNDKNKESWYRTEYFVSATPEEIEQYNFEKKVNDYNL